MSVETDFRAALLARAELVALVGQRVAQNAVEPQQALPLVVFTSAHAPEYAIDNSLIADQVTLETQCWAQSALQADAVAAEVQAAVEAAGHLVTSRASAYDGDLDLHATVLTVEWWHQ